MTRATNATGLLALRAALGVVFIAHGGQKLFGIWGGPGLDGASETFDGLGIPAPDVMAPFVSTLEFVGGIALIVGLAVPLVGLLLAGNMTVALFTAHAENGFFVSNGGIELVLILGAASLSLALTGAGRLSLDEGLGLTDRARARFGLGDRRSQATG